MHKPSNRNPIRGISSWLSIACCKISKGTGCSTVLYPLDNKGSSWEVYGWSDCGNVSGKQCVWCVGVTSESLITGPKKCFWCLRGRLPGGCGGAGIVRVPGTCEGFFLNDIFWTVITKRCNQKSCLQKVYLLSFKWFLSPNFPTDEKAAIKLYMQLCCETYQWCFNSKY